MAKVVTVKTAKKDMALTDELRKEVEKLAHKFYIDGGSREGYEKEDWARAESVVRYIHGHFESRILRKRSGKAILS